MQRANPHHRITAESKEAVRLKTRIATMTSLMRRHR